MEQAQILIVANVATELKKKTRQSGTTTFLWNPEEPRFLWFLIDVAKIELARENKSPYLGEYLLKLELSKNHPFQPPVFRVLTPNGYFMKGDAPCVMVGHYHQSQNTYNTAGGLFGFVEYIVSAFVDHENSRTQSGVGIKKEPVEVCERLASESRAYNRKKHKEMMTLMDMEKLGALRARMRVLKKTLAKNGVSTEAAASLTARLEDIEKEGKFPLPDEIFAEADRIEKAGREAVTALSSLESKMGDLSVNSGGVNEGRAVAAETPAQGLAPEPVPELAPEVPSSLDGASTQTIHQPQKLTQSTSEGGPSTPTQEPAPEPSLEPAVSQPQVVKPVSRGTKTPNPRAAEFDEGYEMVSENDGAVYLVKVQANGVKRWIKKK